MIDLDRSISDQAGININKVECRFVSATDYSADEQVLI